MKLYTIKDLNQGAGLFDHIMRSAREFPSGHAEMPAPVAVGVVASAMKSGLTCDEIIEVTQGYFDEATAELLGRVQATFSGDDDRVHLWHRQADGTYRLNAFLDYYCRPNWRHERYPSAA